MEVRDLSLQMARMDGFLLVEASLAQIGHSPRLSVSSDLRSGCLESIVWCVLNTEECSCTLHVPHDILEEAVLG